VTVEEQPRSFGEQSKQPKVPEVGKGALEVEKFGLVIADLTPELADALGYAEGTKGCLVVTVQRRGPAGRAGIRPGMLVLGVNGKATATAKAAGAALENASNRKGIEVEVRGPRGGKQTVTLSEEE
jgi:serine protease Do